MSELVFVYGTLRRGGSNHHRMTGSEFVSRASVAGQLYKVGWYPGLVLGGAGRVMGELFRVSPELLAALDFYEGEEYERILYSVMAANSRTMEANVWKWDRPIETLEVIAGGDWLGVGGF